MKWLAQMIVRILGPVICALGLERVLHTVEVGAAMLAGKGIGAVTGPGDDLRWETVAAARCITRPDPVLMDLGANRGEWSRLMVARFPQAAHLIMVEPIAELAGKLAAIDFGRKTVVDAAVADAAGTAKLFYYPQSPNISSLHARKEMQFGDPSVLERTVKVTTIDAIVEELKLARIDFMKMDLEGHELAALRGASEAISRGIIKAISFEIGTSNINSRTFFRDCWELLTAAGYRIKRIVPGGHLLDIQHYTEDLEYFSYFTNYVAVLQR